MLNNLQRMRLKLLQKEQFKKKAEATSDSLVLKFLIKSQKFRRNYSKVIEKQLQMNMRKKYLKKRSSEERQEIIDELGLKQYNNAI